MFDDLVPTPFTNYYACAEVGHDIRAVPFPVQAPPLFNATKVRPVQSCGNMRHVNKPYLNG